MPNAYCGEGENHAPHDWFSRLANYAVRCQGKGHYRNHWAFFDNQCAECWDDQGAT